MTRSIRGANKIWRSALAGMLLAGACAGSVLGAPLRGPQSGTGGSLSPGLLPAVAAQPAAPQGAVLSDEDFLDNRAGWPEGSTAFFAEDGYHITLPPAETRTTFSYQPQRTIRAADVSVEATIQLLEAPDSREFGIAIRATSVPRQAYWLLVNPQLGMFTLYRYIPSTNATPSASATLIPWQRSDAIARDGSANTIRLVARGKVLSVYFNGTQAGWVEDEAITDAGAAQIISQDSAHIVVRRLTIREATEQEVAPLAAVPPLFTDHFFDNRERWNLTEEVFLEADGLHVRLGEARGTRLVGIVPRTSPFVADVAVEADITFQDGREDRPFGLMVRSSTGGGYYFLVNAEGSFSIQAWRDGSATTSALSPWRRTSAIRPGTAMNTLKFVAHGSWRMPTVCSWPAWRTLPSKDRAGSRWSRPTAPTSPSAAWQQPSPRQQTWAPLQPPHVR